MHLNLPDSFDLAPLLVALERVAAAQGHAVKGRASDGQLIADFVPEPPALRAYVASSAEVIPFPRVRRAYRASQPPRAA
jgi:hypothetical protein